MGNMHSCTFIKNNQPIIIVVDRAKVGPDYILDPVKSTKAISVYKHVYDDKQPPIHCARNVSYGYYVKEIARTVSHDKYIATSEKHGKKMTKHSSHPYPPDLAKKSVANEEIFNHQPHSASQSIRNFGSLPRNLKSF